MTSLDKSHSVQIIGKGGTCPLCFQDQLSSFPLRLNDSFIYSYSDEREIEIMFGLGKKLKP
ncbi:MAG: hypothetical protein E6K97_11145 [Thaumarchaeota archaeon]|nr:MAG: hypothetical protein E6K97_11145 [Nitrososphaerota archaeon]